MTRNQFVNFIRNCNPENITDIALERNNELIKLSEIKMSKDNKMLCFVTDDREKSFNSLKYWITDVKVLNDSHEGYQWSIKFYENPKDNRLEPDTFIVHINMIEGFSPFAYRTNFLDNYENVTAAIPEYLDAFIGKNVLVCHSTNTATYNTFDDDGETLITPMTDSYVIDDFQYTVFYNEIAPNIPCIKIFSGNREDIFACAMGVKLVTPNLISTFDGSYVLKVVE